MKWPKWIGIGCLLFAPFLWGQSYMASPSGGGSNGDDLARKYAEEMAAVERGRMLYQRACEACHGANGDGKGPAAEALNPRPRDFTTGKFKFRSTPAGELPTDQDLYNTIANGVPRTFMPAWKGLMTEQNIWDLVAYIKTFSEGFRKRGPGQPIPMPEEVPPATEESIFEGEQVYKIMECWSCHGAKGNGKGPSAGDLQDDWGQKIKPFNFSVGRYKSGEGALAIYKAVNTGLDGTPMPSYREDFLYPRDAFEDLSNLEEVYPQSEIDELREYLNTIPTEAQLEAMSEKEQEKLAEKRRWALVHYVQSLSRKGSLLRTLFFDNTDETQ
ncbi:MAG: hypothetical protein D6681_18240 [Calditrichaeota bacterium]|nr:MAG: hypothetical protein D6681_18240 [Calditrichota bacterium]